MYKLIVCDLDETLIGDDSIIPVENIKAINEASKLGVKFVPATGRGHKSITNVLNALELYDKEDEYIISFNGGGIIECKDYKVINYENIDFDLAKRIFEAGLSKGICIHVYTKDDVYIFNLNENEEQYALTRLPGFINVEDNSIEFLRDVPIAKVLFQHLDREYLMEIENDMQEIILGNISITYSSNRYMEFVKLGIDKGVGLLNLAERLGIKQNEIMAIGDNFNDMAMLKAAGLSVAVNNAVEDIKNIADYVCDADNNEGAVAEAINKFVLNK